MINKEHAMKISEMWRRIAESETPHCFWFRTPIGGWVQTNVAPMLSSNSESWKVAPFNGTPMQSESAKYFADLWRKHAEGYEVQYWSNWAGDWVSSSIGPDFRDNPNTWRVVPPAKQPSTTPTVVAWKRTDTSEFTDDPTEAAFWEKRNYPIQKLVAEQA